MLKKLSVRLSLALIVVMGVVFTVFAIYLVNNRTEQMHNMILSKGIASAQTGAKIMGTILENIVENKLFTREEIFNDSLIEIPFSAEVIQKYKHISFKKLKVIQKYHYANSFDSLLDTTIFTIQNEFFKDPQVIFAVLCDNQGYTPTHNSIFNQPLIGDFKIDNERSRNKRIYYDPKVSKNTSEPYLKYVYHRDTGEEMWRISSPVFVFGKHWGSFRIGFSMEKTEEKLSELKYSLIWMVLVLMFFSVLLINRITALMMRPLHSLHQAVESVATGDLTFKSTIKSKGEIGDLSAAFEKMTLDLQHYIKNLQETTATKERIQSELRVGYEIQSQMLPHRFPAFPNRTDFDIYAIMNPAKEVGGDFYDFFFSAPDKLFFIIADVSGKGVPAALFMVISKTLVHTEALRKLSLEEVFFNVNKLLSTDNEAYMFATALAGLLDLKTGELQLMNAGHNPPLLKRGNTNYEFLELQQNMAWGIVDGIEFVSTKVQLLKGDTIFFYTDGVTEANNEKEELFEDENLKKALNSQKFENLTQTVQHVRAEINNFAGEAQQSDDITILALSYFGQKTQADEK